MYSPRDIIDIIAANVRKTRNPFGMPKVLCNRWWQDSSMPAKGDALLFTGLMYQFVPYIEKSTRYLEQFEDTPWADYVRYAKYVPNYLAGMGLALLTPAKEKKRFNAILQNIAKILTKSKVDFFYRPELDEYSGILLYDLGDQESGRAEFIEARPYQKERSVDAGACGHLTAEAGPYVVLVRSLHRIMDHPDDFNIRRQPLIMFVPLSASTNFNLQLPISIIIIPSAIFHHRINPAGIPLRFKLIKINHPAVNACFFRPGRSQYFIHRQIQDYPCQVV